MNALEMSNEFDIQYNNIMSNAAPPLSEYEKSIFLTTAQEEIVADLIGEFEKSEQIRQYLKPLLVTTKLTTPVANTHTISTNSTCFSLPTNLQYITFEEVKLANVSDNATVKVVSQDMFEHIKKNPFKGPNSTRVLRLDGFESNPIVELITDGQAITSYLLKYIKRPYPIILEVLTNNTIDGQNTPLSGSSVSELPISIHSTIVSRATQLAKLSYLGTPAKSN